MHPVPPVDVQSVVSIRPLLCVYLLSLFLVALPRQTKMAPGYYMLFLRIRWTAYKEHLSDDEQLHHLGI